MSKTVTFSFLAFQSAVQSLFPHFGAIVVCDAFEAIHGRPPSDDTPLRPNEAGAILARLVMQGEDPELALHSIALTTGLFGRTIHLTIEQALDHPVLKGWIGRTFGECLGVAIKAGADGSSLASNAPCGWSYRMIASDGHRELTGTLVFGTDPYLAATITFGTSDPNSRIKTTTDLTGQAVLDLGAYAFDGSGAPLPGTLAGAIQAHVAQHDAPHATKH
jgi:hypothetical protein